jgi:YD repeat-containing protein
MERSNGMTQQRCILQLHAGRASARSLCAIFLVLIAGLFSTTGNAADTQKPTAPAALTATAASSTQINLSWTASTDNVGVTGYRIERCSGASCTNYAQIATTTTATTYSNTGLTVSTAYRYRVRANDAAGNLSSYSGIATATTLADTQAPSVPSALTATAASGTQINLSWTASTDNVSVTGYRIERCSGIGCSSFTQIATTTTATTYNNTGLTTATSYSYRIRANDAAGNLSSYSSVVTTSTLDTTAPTTPAGLTASVISSSQLNLTWAASTDNVAVTGYRIERCTGSSCTNYAQIATSTTASYSNTGLTAATAYRYRVRANDAAGNLSGYSTVVTATTQAADTQAPTAPAGLTATATSSTQINLIWTASTDNVGVTAYLLERCQGAGCSTFTQIASQAGSTYSDASLSPATTYSYRVRARDAANNLSGYSSIATVATQYAGPITFTYTYDNLGRVTQASGSDGSVITYTYDANGNVTSINRQ